MTGKTAKLISPTKLELEDTKDGTITVDQHDDDKVLIFAHHYIGEEILDGKANNEPSAPFVAHLERIAAILQKDGYTATLRKSGPREFLEREANAILTVSRHGSKIIKEKDVFRSIARGEFMEKARKEIPGLRVSDEHLAKLFEIAHPIEREQGMGL